MADCATIKGCLWENSIHLMKRNAYCMYQHALMSISHYNTYILINNFKTQLYSSQYGSLVFVVCVRDDILPDILCVTLKAYFGKVLLRHLEFYLDQLNLISTFLN